MNNKKICFIVTVSMTVDQFLRFSFEKFHDAGYEIFVVADMTDDYIKTLPSYIHAVSVPMKRGIDFIGMFRALKTMYFLFRQKKFDIVQYSTPNASFYAAIASFLSRVPVRLYCQWGLVYQGFHGIKRIVFEKIERFICKLSTDIQPDSSGNLNLCRSLRYYPPEKSRVVWNGSANGINLKKFHWDAKESFCQQIRNDWNIPMDACVLGFVGRVGKEKGFDELMDMFRILRHKYPSLILLYVGPNEKPDSVNKGSLDFFENCDAIRYTGGWVDDTERYFAAMDILIFPTYHEGFGSVTIEAEAMGVPVIVSDVPGPQDALIDGVTGFKVPAKNVDILVEKAEILITDAPKRKTMGLAGKAFVTANFDDRILLQKMIENRDWLIARTLKK